MNDETNKARETADTTIKPPSDITIYQTKTRIQNPSGDGRHNRAQWRSLLHKTTIPEGFIFGVDADGNIYDMSRAVAMLPARGNKELRARLLEVASDPLPYQVQQTSEAEEEQEDDPVALLEKKFRGIPKAVLIRKLAEAEAGIHGPSDRAST